MKQPKSNKNKSKVRKLKAWAVALRGRIQMFWDDNLVFEIFYSPHGARKCAQRYSKKYDKKYKAVPIVMYKINHLTKNK